MKIIFKTLKQDIYELDIIDDQIKIQELKKILEENFGFDHSRIKFLFNSSILDNDKTLGDYNISDNFSIILANVKIIDDYKKVHSNLESSEELSEKSLNDPIELIENEKIIETEIKAENAVKYIASIMKILSLYDANQGKEFIKIFEKDNPQVMAIIKKNHQEFTNLLYAPKTKEDVKIYKKFYHSQINEASLSEQDENIIEEEINKLIEYGFDYYKSKEAYIMCNKNINKALNYLLDNEQYK